MAELAISSGGGGVTKSDDRVRGGNGCRNTNEVS